MTHTDQTGDLPAADDSPDTPVDITTFGYRHGPPPDAHLTLDLRNLWADFRPLSADDDAVHTTVLATPGIRPLVDAAAAAVAAYVSGPSDETVTVAVGSADGRHRAAVFGNELVRVLDHYWIAATVSHRDLDKPVARTRTLDQGGSHR